MEQAISLKSRPCATSNSEGCRQEKVINNTIRNHIKFSRKTYKVLSWLQSCSMVCCLHVLEVHHRQDLPVCPHMSASFQCSDSAQHAQSFICCSFKLRQFVTMFSKSKGEGSWIIQKTNILFRQNNKKQNIKSLKNIRKFCIEFDS